MERLHRRSETRATRDLSGRAFFLAGLLIAVLLTGCEKKAAPPPPPPPAVTVALPGSKTVAVFGEYVGLVDSPQTVDLVVRIEGFLKEVCFQEGTEVEKGALMFVIDSGPYEVALQKAKAQSLLADASLASAKAALVQAKNVKDIEVDRANLLRDKAVLANAEKVFDDASKMLEAKAIVRSQWDTADALLKTARANVDAASAKLAQSEGDYQTRVAQAEANVAQADANIAVAKAAVADADLNLSYTKIYTPVKGRVGLARAKIGQLIGHNEPMGTVLATVSLVDPIHVNFTVSERELFELRRLADLKGLGRSVIGKVPVKMVLEDGSIYPQEGVINFTDRALSANTGTLKMRAEFPNPSGFLRPGNYAKIRMPLTELPNAMVISERALSTDQSGPFVLVVNGENTVDYRSVKLGPKADGGMVVIESGLKPEDKVIVKGLQRARLGNKVTPALEESQTAVQETPGRTNAASTAASTPKTEPK